MPPKSENCIALASANPKSVVFCLRWPSGFGFARHPLDRPANSAPAHHQSETVFENGGSIGMRQSQEFVHQHSQAVDGEEYDSEPLCPFPALEETQTSGERANA
jgi:hypothetical protein